MGRGGLPAPRTRPVTMVVESLDRLGGMRGSRHGQHGVRPFSIGRATKRLLIVADLAAATAWYSARLGTAPVTCSGCASHRPDRQMRRSTVRQGAARAHLAVKIHNREGSAG